MTTSAHKVSRYTDRRSPCLCASKHIFVLDGLPDGIVIETLGAEPWILHLEKYTFVFTPLYT